MTAAIMAQLDGEREVVVKLAGEALHVADEVSTRQWRQWARSLQWWAGEGIGGAGAAGAPAPSLLRDAAGGRPARQCGAGARTARRCAQYGAARRASSSVRPRSCRLRAGVLRRAHQVEEAAREYEDAVGVARKQGARMLELRALTDWMGLPGAPGQRPGGTGSLRGRHCGRGTEPEPRRGTPRVRAAVSRTSWDDAFLDSLVPRPIGRRTPSSPACSHSRGTQRRPSGRWWCSTTRRPTRDAAALSSAYACWRGVQVLGLTARIGTDAKRLLNETAQGVRRVERVDDQAHASPTARFDT